MEGAYAFSLRAWVQVASIISFDDVMNFSSKKNQLRGREGKKWIGKRRLGSGAQWRLELYYPVCVGLGDICIQC